MKARTKRLLMALLVGTLIGSIILAGCAAPAPAPATTYTSPDREEDAVYTSPDREEDAVYKGSDSEAPAVYTQAPVEVIEWKMATLYPPAYEDYIKYTKLFIDLVNERSNGQIEIELFLGGSLLTVDEHYDAVRTNAVDMVVTAGPYFSGIIPEADIEMSLPFTWMDLAMFISLWYDSGIQDILRDAYAEHNIYYVGPLIEGEYGVFTANPVNSVSDFEGLKIRAMGFWGEYVGALGGSPSAIVPSEVPMALKTGTIDGLMYSLSGVISAELYDVVKYAILPPFIKNMISSILMNSDEWNKLPAHLKDVVNWSAFEAGLRQGAYLQSMEAEYYPQASEVGMTIINLPEEEVKILRQKAVEVWGVFAEKTPRTGQMIEILTDYLTARGLL